VTVTYTTGQFEGDLTCSSAKIMYSTGTVGMPYLKIREFE